MSLISYSQKVLKLRKLYDNIKNKNLISMKKFKYEIAKFYYLKKNKNYIYKKLAKKNKIKRFMGFRKYVFAKNRNKLFFLYYKIIKNQYFGNTETNLYNQLIINKYKVNYKSTFNNRFKTKNTITYIDKYRKSNILGINKYISKYNKINLLNLIGQYVPNNKKQTLLKYIFSANLTQLKKINKKYRFKKYKVNKLKYRARIRKKIRLKNTKYNLISSLSSKRNSIENIINNKTTFTRFNNKYIKYLLSFNYEYKQVDYVLLLDVLIENILHKQRKKVELFNIKIKQNWDKIKMLKKKNRIKKYIKYKKINMENNRYILKNKILRRINAIKKIINGKNKKIKIKNYYRKVLEKTRIINKFLRKKLISKLSFKIKNKKYKLFRKKRNSKKKFNYVKKKNKILYININKRIKICFNKNTISMYNKQSYLLNKYINKLISFYKNIIYYNNSLNSLLQLKNNILHGHIIDHEFININSINRIKIIKKWINKNKDLQIDPVNNILYNNIDTATDYLQNINDSIVLSDNNIFNIKLLKKKIFYLYNKLYRILFNIDLNYVNNEIVITIKNRLKQFIDDIINLKKSLLINELSKLNIIYLNFIKFKCDYIILKKKLYQNLYLDNKNTFIKYNNNLGNKVINKYKQMLNTKKHIDIKIAVYGYKNKILYNHLSINITDKSLRKKYLLYIYKFIRFFNNNGDLLLKYYKYKMSSIFTIEDFYNWNSFNKVLKLILVEKHSNARYLIINDKLILHSRSVGSLGFFKKDRRMKKWRKKLGEYLTYWTSKKLKESKYNYIHIYTKGKRRVVKFLYYKLKYYLRKRSRKILKMRRYQIKQIKYILRTFRQNMKSYNLIKAIKNKNIKIKKKIIIEKRMKKINKMNKILKKPVIKIKKKINSKKKILKKKKNK